ncbi:MAG TPA: hypothetical protein VHL77_07670 [Ferruginibacter sp.]|nr:hypothetical protein [Ferruginibacter sp.]
MLEIIALIFLTKNIGALALKKGLKPGLWKLYTVLSWIGAEIIGIIIAASILGADNIIFAALIGLACAVGSYFVIRAILNKRPDAMEEDINRIGVSDLYPERPNRTSL